MYIYIYMFILMGSDDINKIHQSQYIYVEFFESVSIYYDLSECTHACMHVRMHMCAQTHSRAYKHSPANAHARSYKFMKSYFSCSLCSYPSIHLFIHASAYMDIHTCI